MHFTFFFTLSDSAQYFVSLLFAQPVRFYPERISPIDVLTDFSFKRQFRFDKDNVVRLTNMLDLEKDNNRGLPLTPVQSVCLTLNHFAGAHFNRVSALCGNVSEHASWDAIDRVRQQILRLQEDFIRMPTVAEMTATEGRMYQRFGLRGFAFGIDGMIARFESAPKGLPEGPGYPNQNSFFTRKMCYGINTLVVANDQHLICALDRDWHGSANDSRIWNQSLFKPLIEQQRRFLLAGDSAFPLSDVLIKPFSNDDALEDPALRLFNSRLSGLRTVMTENTFAIWKRRFPCLKNLRAWYYNARYIV